MKFLDIERTLKKKHKEIRNSFSKLDNSTKQSEYNWKYRGDGGGKSIEVNSGKIIEKAAINFSSIQGNILPKSALAKKLQIKKSKFKATGISVVVHPENPHVPCSHLNVRYFYINRDLWWFGGGFDLTPYFPYKDDVKLWHTLAKNVCDKHDKAFYKKFSKLCDDYFYLPHRNEKRGIGGIFFDNLNNLEMSKHLDFIVDVVDGYLDAYNQIVKKRSITKYSQIQKEFQLYRRGRYVEFNLLYDRGTTFGLQSGGRAESILMSLPPNVKWAATRDKKFDKFENNLMKFI